MKTKRYSFKEQLKANISLFSNDLYVICKYLLNDTEFITYNCAIKIK